MGYSRWDADKWDSYSSTTSHKPREEIFKSRSLKVDFDPLNITMRESRDSDANPHSTPIIVGLDVTGSMGQIPHQLVKGNLGTLMEELLARKPVSDPHLMFMGIGDVRFDKAPLQVTQFEADITIAKQLEEIYLEGGGGGNSTESYNLPWLFAAMKTSVDSVIKRGKKGYLFTIGDEEAPNTLSISDQAKIGINSEAPLTNQQLIEMASVNYHIFHIVVEQGNHFRYSESAVRKSWNETLGQHVIYLSDYTKLAEVIVSTIQAMEGESVSDITSSWSGDTSLVVGSAIKDLATKNDSGDLVVF